MPSPAASGSNLGAHEVREQKHQVQQPVVLEQRDEPNTQPKANGLLGQVVRVMDHRGLHERLTGSTEPPAPNSAYFMFGGLGLDLSLLPRSPVYSLPATQQKIEEVLKERAVQLGVQIRRGHELVDMSQNEDGVTLRIATAEDEYELRTHFAVGADGAHSVTRKLTGIDFPGVHHDRMTVRSAHVMLPSGWVDHGTGALTCPATARCLRSFRIEQNAADSRTHPFPDNRPSSPRPSGISRNRPNP